MTDPQQPQLPVQQLPTATTEQTQQPSLFTLGASSSVQNQTKNSGPQTAEQVAAERSKQLLGDQNFAESNRRGRNDYAETLRKKRREEDRRAKRQHFGGNTVVPQVSSVIPNQSTPAMGAGVAGTIPGSPQPISFGHQSGQSQMNIEQILAASQQMPPAQVIQEANNMQCQQSEFDQIVQLLGSDVQLIQIIAATGLRKLLSFEQDPPIQKTVDRNLIPRLFMLAQSQESPKLQFEAIWCLTNIASSDSHFVLKLIENQAMPILISILDTPTHIEVKEQTIWCLGNISGDNSRFRDALLDQNLLPRICQLVESAAANTSFVRNAIWTLANLCKGKPTPDFDKVSRAIPTFAKVIAETDTHEILNDIVWTLSYITDEGGDERIFVFLQCNLVPRLNQLLHHEQMIIAVPCLRTLGNILTAKDEYAMAAINHGVLESFTQLLDHPKKAIRKEICWSISNVTAGSTEQIQKCIDIGLIDKIIAMMGTASMDIKQEAVWCLSNSTAQATPLQIQVLVQKGIIQAIGAVLECREPRTLIVALEGINFILKIGQEHLINDQGVNPMVQICEACGIIDKLEQLQLVQNQKVYEKAIDILEKFFILEENNDIMQMLNQPSTNGQDQTTAQSNEAASLWGNQSNTQQQNFNF